jgi:hypothetical protein
MPLPDCLVIHPQEGWMSRSAAETDCRRVGAANHKAVRKGHCYASLLIDLSGGGVIEMVEERLPSQQYTLA